MDDPSQSNGFDFQQKKKKEVGKDKKENVVFGKNKEEKKVEEVVSEVKMGKKMIFGQNIKKQEKYKEGMFMEEFMRGREKVEEEVMDESKRNVLNEKIGLVKLMGENRMKHLHLMELYLELGEMEEVVKVHRGIRGKKSDDQLDNLCVEALLRGEKLTGELEEMMKVCQFVYPQHRTAFLSLVVASQDSGCLERHLGCLKGESTSEEVIKGDSPDFSPFSEYLSEQLKGHFPSDSSTRLSLFLKYWQSSSLTSPVDVKSLLNAIHSAHPSSLLLSVSFKETDQVQDIRSAILQTLIQKGTFNENTVDFSTVGSFIRLMIDKEGMSSANHLLQHSRGMDLYDVIPIGGLTTDQVTEGYIEMRNSHSHLTMNSLLFYLKIAVETKAVEVCTDIYENQKSLLQTTNPEKDFVKRVYGGMLAMCGQVKVEGDTNMNLLRQVLGQAKEQDFKVEALLSPMQFEVLKMQVYILDGDLEGAAKVLEEKVLQNHLVERTRAQLKLMLYEAHDLQRDTSKLNAIVDRLSDDQIYTLYQDNTTLNKMIQSFSGKSLAQFWHTSQRLAKIQRAARAIGSFDKANAKEILKELIQKEEHPLVRADYQYVLDDYDDLMKWSQSLQKEYRQKALRIELLEEMSTHIMESEEAVNVASLQNRLAEVGHLIVGSEEQHDVDKMKPKAIKKMFRKEAERMNELEEEDKEEFVFDLVMKQHEVVEQAIRTSEYMQGLRREKGINDTLYHLDDPDTYNDFRENLETQEPQDILTMFRGHFEEAGPHVHLPDDPLLTQLMANLALWGIQQHQPIAVQLAEKYYSSINLPLPAPLVQQLDHYYRYRILQSDHQSKLQEAYSVLGAIDRNWIYRDNLSHDSLRDMFNPLEESFLNKMRMNPQMRDQAEYRFTQGAKFVYEDNLTQQERLKLKYQSI